MVDHNFKPWWFNKFDLLERKKLIQAFDNRNFTYGRTGKNFERNFAKKIGAKYAVVTNSGTSAILMSLISIGIGEGDEVIVPSIGWIATAQAIQLTGARAVIADVQQDKPIININAISKLISKKTKAIIVVHYNGRIVDIKKLKKLIAHKSSKIRIIEDCCKSMFSKNKKFNDGKFAGTIGEIGCFSLGMISLISSTYGGICITNNKKIYENLKIVRWHGVKFKKNQNLPNEIYKYRSMNFKPSELLFSISSAQLTCFENRKKNLIELYTKYKKLIDEINSPHLSLIEVDIKNGEIPLLIDVFSTKANKLIECLSNYKIQTCRFHAPLYEASYLKNNPKSKIYINSNYFSKFSFHLPSGIYRKDLNEKYFIKLRKILSNFKK